MKSENRIHHLHPLQRLRLDAARPNGQPVEVEVQGPRGDLVLHSDDRALRKLKLLGDVADLDAGADQANITVVKNGVPDADRVGFGALGHVSTDTDREPICLWVGVHQDVDLEVGIPGHLQGRLGSDDLPAHVRGLDLIPAHPQGGGVRLRDGVEAQEGLQV
eukprot:CAMPEP_0115069866 /NCGR_PEP_ID=MMETSP0227-20121206/12796_1 /TAXON_ID=89957 /ORGANISM="Polarella glacialis, Strain CCMP 1383" /LENGTH=161 /DNA_ID=CAMNT_0002456317 /DNA_START=155 /DNA_END=640 /DNA_ORIENTATION=+